MTETAAKALCYFKGQVSYGLTCPYQLVNGQPVNIAQNHMAGHMLSVALYLLAHGGFNPAPGAPYVNVPSLGNEKASRIMSRTFVFYLTPTALWEDIPAAAVRSAFDAYGTCTEPNATAAASAAIGYPNGGQC